MVADAESPDTGDLVDGPSGCVPDTIVCDDATRHYVDCSSTGTVEFEMTCPVACDDDSEVCLDVDPSNGLAANLDMASAGPDVVFTGTSLLQDAVVFNNGVAIDVPTEVVNGIRVYMFNSLQITGTLTNFRKNNQTQPIAFVVNGDVVINGLLDVSAQGSQGGPGGGMGYGDGAKCYGNGMGVSGSSPSPGGSGAGGAGPGGSGGVAGNGEIAPAFGPGGGELDLEPLAGGCAGGSSSESQTEISSGGGGGGGIQIVSRTRISLIANGVIDASGGGGGTGTTGSGTLGGGGGGAGGNVLLEAPQVVLDGAGVVISTKGGSGGATGSGNTFSGADGGTAPGPTPGGVNPAGADGGAGAIGGAAGGTAAAPGEAGVTSSGDGGGGGGGGGRSRFNTSSGFINPINGASIHSSYSALNATPLRTRPVPTDPT